MGPRSLAETSDPVRYCPLPCCKRHSIQGEQHLAGQRLCGAPVLIDGHLGSALLGGFHDSPVHCGAEVFPDVGQRFHYQPIPIIVIEIAEDTKQDARFACEALLRARDG